MSQNRLDRNRIGKTYAHAVYDVAQQQKTTDAIEKELAELAKHFQDSTEFAVAAANPLISKTELRTAVDAITKKAKCSDIVSNLCALLVENRRLSLIPEINDAFAKRAADERNEKQVIIRSAKALTKKQLTTVESLVKDATQCVPVISAEVDETLLAGFTLEIGSQMIDASLNGQLNQLQQHLTSINS